LSVAPYHPKNEQTFWLRWSGGGVVLVGAVAIVGHLTGVTLLARWLPASPAMMLNTAVSLILCGASLIALDAGANRLAAIFGAFVTLFCTFTEVLFTLGYSVGLDEYFIDHQWVLRLPSSSGIPPNTVVALALAGGIIWALAARIPARSLILGACGVVATFALLPLLGFVTSLVSQTAYEGMSLPTTTALLVLAAALLGRARAKTTTGLTSLPFMTAAVGMLLSTGIVAVESNRAMIDMNFKVVQSYEVTGALDHLVAAVARMESSARGYALNGIEAYRERIDVHYAVVTQELDRVQRLLADEPPQLARLRELRELVGQKYSYNGQMVRARKEHGVQAAATAMTAQPTEVTSALVNLSDVMHEEEMRRLTLRERDRGSLENNARAMQLLGGMLALSLLLVALRLTRSAERARSVAEQELKVANENLELRVAQRTEELERANRRLSERERSLRFLADSMPQLVWTLQPDGRSESYNQEWRNYTGLTDEESRDGGWTRVLHPDDAGSIRLSRQALQAGQLEQNGEYRLRRAADGMYRWHLWRSRAELNSEGRIMRWVGTSTDIHDQKTAAELLEQRIEERTAELAGAMRLQRAVLDGTVLSIISTTPDGTIETFNRGAEKMLGYGRAELAGKLTPAVIHDPAEVAARAATLSRELGRTIEPGFEAFVARTRLGEVDEREWTYVRKDGTRLPVWLSVTALRNDRGEITGFLGIAADLTERRQAETMLRDAFHQLEQQKFALDQHADVAVTDIDGRITYANERFCALSGYSREELLGQNHRLINSGWHPPEFFRELYATLARGAVWQGEIRNRAKNGRFYWVDATIVPFLNAAGKPTHFVAIRTDITAKRESADRLRQQHDALTAVTRERSRGTVAPGEMLRLLAEAGARSLAVERASVWLLSEDHTKLDCQVLYEAASGRFSSGISLPATRYPAYFAALEDGRYIAAQHAQDDARTAEFAPGYLRPLGITSMLDATVRREGRLAGVVCFEHVGLPREWQPDEQSFAGSIADLVQVELEAENRRNAETALRASQQRLTDVFRSMAEGLVLRNAAGTVVECNAAAERILGLTRQELLGWGSADPRWSAVRSDGSPFPDHDHPAMVTLRTGAACANVEMGLHRADGSLTWLIINTEPVAGPQGELQMVVSSFSDITERKRAAQALAESEERFRSSFDNAGIGMGLVNLEGRWIRVNRALCEIVGYSEDELLQRSFQELTHPDDLEADLAHGRLLMAGKIRTFTMDKRYIHRDGHSVWIKLTTSLVRSADGTPLLTVSHIEDVSERKRLVDSLSVARDEALQASRLKSEFLANMSHEIRTPMNGIIGMAGLMMDTPLSHEQREMGQVLQNSAENLLAIINDILDFSKIEAGKMRLEMETFDLRALVDDTLALLAPRAHSKQLELACDFEAGRSWRLRGDPGRIRQVMMNLVNNAVKFTEAGEVVIVVRTRPAAPGRTGLRVEVRDTGIGIPRDQQGKLFQAFVQADGTTTRRHGGTGLGLAISRQLVGLMGGDIGFTSEVGRGSCFWFHLDLAEAATPGEAPLAPGPQPGPLRLLVVDDNETNRRILHGQLTHLDMAVELAATGREGLLLLRDRQRQDRAFHAAFLDWHMPEMNGLDLALEIRGDPAIANTVLIMLSSAGQAVDPAIAAKIRLDALLAKPVREAQLFQTLYRLAGASDGRREPAPAELRSTSGMRLLVAEDNSANQLVARLTLEKLGHECVLANDGEEALTQLARNRFDAVLMDCQMPILDGYAATRRIRAGLVPGVDARIPIIAVTAYAMPSDRLRCISAGMSDYITKPLRTPELVEALMRCGLKTAATVPAPPSPARPPPEPAADAPSLIDAAQVRQLRGLPGRKHGTLLQDLIFMFTEETPTVLAQLQELAAQRDASALTMKAHRLAGGCANLGGRTMRQVALRVEKLGKNEAWAEIPAALAELDQEWNRLRPALAQLQTEPAL
jgi:PAS domain S-box-containing protein